MAREHNRSRSAGNAGNAGNRQPRRARLKIGYTDLQKHADGTYSAKLTAEVSGGRGDEQVQFWMDLVPMGTEISVDEFGHAQTLATGFSGANHAVKAALIDEHGRIIRGTEVSRMMDLAKAPKFADKLHVRAVGRGRVFVLIAVQAQDGSPVKGAIVNIYETGELPFGTSVRIVPLFTSETNMHGALEPAPYFDVLPIHGKRVLLIHVAGTKLEEFVVCRPAEHHSSLKPEDFDDEMRVIRKKPFGTRLIWACIAGWRLGGKELRRQEEEARNVAFH